MFDAYDEMKNMQAALEYRTGLMEVKKTMFEPGSTLCKVRWCRSFVAQNYFSESFSYRLLDFSINSSSMMP